MLEDNLTSRLSVYASNVERSVFRLTPRPLREPVRVRACGLEGIVNPHEWALHGQGTLVVGTACKTACDVLLG